MPSARLSSSWPCALAIASLFVVACSSSSASSDGGVTLDGPKVNACTAYGQGYTCQSGTACRAGFVNKQDLDCASSGQLCCGPIGEAGIDASDDATIFVDGASFDVSPPDAAPADARTPDATIHDAGQAHDAGKAPADAGEDSAHHDAGQSHDAGSDAGHAIEDGSSDARHG